MKDIEKKKDSEALQYAKKILTNVKSKANSNKRWATFLFCISIISTSLTPILILITNDPFWGKYLPAILTAIASISSSWIALRKPQERWVIYRTAQREIEYQIDQYNFENGIYRNKNKDSLLADKVSNRALALHYEWIPYVPKTEDFQKITNESK